MGQSVIGNVLLPICMSSTGDFYVPLSSIAYEGLSLVEIRHAPDHVSFSGGRVDVIPGSTQPVISFFPSCCLGSDTGCPDPIPYLCSYRKMTIRIREPFGGHILEIILVVDEDESVEDYSSSSDAVRMKLKVLSSDDSDVIKISCFDGVDESAEEFYTNEIILSEINDDVVWNVFSLNTANFNVIIRRLVR